MRKTLINITAFSAHGVVCASNGLTLGMWGYWALLACMVAVLLNYTLD